jgi:glucose uptake protein
MEARKPMFVPTTFAAALLMTIISTICWGSFANTLKLTRNYRFELYYWDYAAGIFLMSLLLALTMGSIPGGSSSFPVNLRAAAGTNLAWAAIGGFIFNVANVLLLAGIEMVGLAIAFPIAIGIALVEGVALSYALQPKGDLGLLAAGVLMAVIAIVLIGMAYSALQGASRKIARKGVVVCVSSGVLMGLFAPFVTRSMTAARPLTPYTVCVLFTFGALVCCFFFNVYLMKKPLVGSPVGFAGYAQAPVAYHVLGLLGGAIWGVGMTFNIVAASLVGVAISYAIGQASPMIAALWGVFAWHEFRGSSGRARAYLAGMFCFYLLALALIARAYRAG